MRRRTFAGTLTLLAMTLIAADAPPAEVPSFVNDVVPVLTRLGCNSGNCHGKLAGQNGFKLSLRGYAPEQDHIAITRDARGRRIAKSRPAASLLLAKPLMKVPHKGGKRLAVNSLEYRTLLAWIAAGAPGPTGQEPAVTKIVVTPEARTYRPEESQALRVEATYDDGKTRDVTRLALFNSNEEGLARVDEQGNVKALRPGATAVMASFQGAVAVHVVTTPYDQPIDPEVYAARVNVIDEHVMERLRQMRLEPSPPCDDATFLRRVSLDLTGALPEPDEVAAFLADPAPDKRAKRVDQLLNSPAYVDYWSMTWGELFQNRVERDHDERGTKGVRGFALWIREQVRNNRPWDAMVRDVLTATGPVNREPAGGYFLVNRTPEDLAEAASHAFLGTRIQCAKCHNHPLERFTQDDYYGMAAFFTRVKLDGPSPDDGQAIENGLPGRRGRGAKTDREKVGIVQPRTGQFLAPTTLDRNPARAPRGRGPPRRAGRVDDREGQPALRPRDRQPGLEEILLRRPDRAGGRPAGDEPLHERAAPVGPQRGPGRARLRPEAPDAADRARQGPTPCRPTRCRRTRRTAGSSRTTTRGVSRPRSWPTP